MFSKAYYVAFAIWHLLLAVAYGSKSRDGLICDDILGCFVCSQRYFGWSLDFGSVTQMGVALVVPQSTEKICIFPDLPS